MAGQQGRQSGQGRNAQGLRCRLPGRQGGDRAADAVPDTTADASAAAATRAAEGNDRSSASCGDSTHRRKPVCDGRPGQIPLHEWNGCVGQSRFKDLSLQRQQDLRPDQSGRVYVRARCNGPGNARREEREAPRRLGSSAPRQAGHMIGLPRTSIAFSILISTPIPASAPA